MLHAPGAKISRASSLRGGLALQCVVTGLMTLRPKRRLGRKAVGCLKRKERTCQGEGGRVGRKT